MEEEAEVAEVLVGEEEDGQGGAELRLQTEPLQLLQSREIQRRAVVQAGLCDVQATEGRQPGEVAANLEITGRDIQYAGIQTGHHNSRSIEQAV